MEIPKDIQDFLQEKDIKNGIEMIAEERQRQIKVEGYDEQHDFKHKVSELIDAANAYVEAARSDYMNETEGLHPEVLEQHYDSIKQLTWRWDDKSFKPTTCLKDLIKAGALIAATIDRILNENNNLK